MSDWGSGKRAIVPGGLILVLGALGLYLTGVRQDAERSRLEPGLRACIEVMGIYAGLDYDGAEAHSASSVEKAGAELARVGRPYPRLLSLVEAIENSRRELLSGEQAGAAIALSRECQGIGWSPPIRP